MIALIDNDFVRKLAEIKWSSEEKVALAKKIFFAKDLEVHMHGLVYDNELLDRKAANPFFEQEAIFVLRWDKMFGDDEEKKAYYCFIVPELFKKLNGVPLGFTSEEVLTKWLYQRSLGEVHSLAACYVCEYGIFLSDDSDSKYLRDIIDAHYDKRIQVYNRRELLDQLEDGMIKKEERRAFTHKT